VRGTFPEDEVKLNELLSERRLERGNPADILNQCATPKIVKSMSELVELPETVVAVS
jgi:hypothetical protein